MAENLIPVTKPYLPSKDKYKEYVDKIYESGWVTNNGPLVQELEKRLADYLGVKHVICVANGSLALHVAYKALDIKGEVVTTPFSFAATSSTLIWEGIKPVFCDIDEKSFNLDPSLIEEKITNETTAILPVHVFGNPCEVEKIQDIAEKYHLKVIYDAAHAFGVNYKGSSILKHGDVSTLSFHATKLFHTIEGGAIITESDEVASKIRKLINFGITGPSTIEGIGTNAKMNEFEAAMGLCILDDIGYIIGERKKIYSYYYNEFSEYPSMIQKFNEFSESTGSYFPLLLKDICDTCDVISRLNSNDIFPRRYFYPSLNEIESYNMSECPVSSEISRNIICLPVYVGLENNDLKLIKNTIKEEVRK